MIFESNSKVVSISAEDTSNAIIVVPKVTFKPTPKVASTFKTIIERPYTEERESVIDV